MSHSVFWKVRRESFILFLRSRFAHACFPFISATLVAQPSRGHTPLDTLIFVNPMECEADHPQLAFLDTRLLEVPRKSAFFSSDESEEEEDHRKKFKIKIKPLPADQVVTVPSVDELKASIGNIALSPSPLVSHGAVPAPLDSSGPAGAAFCTVSWLLFLT